MSDDISRIIFQAEFEGFGEAKGEFVRFLAPRTIDALLMLLPLRGRISISKAQLYFGVPLKTGYEKAISRVEKGDVAYWPFGSALCFFREEMQPYRPVNLVGKISSGVELLQNVVSGTSIKIDRCSDAL